MNRICSKRQEMYDLKHELISLKMQIEEAAKSERGTGARACWKARFVSWKRNWMNCSNRQNERGDCFGNLLSFLGRV